MQIISHQLDLLGGLKITADYFGEILSKFQDIQPKIAMKRIQDRDELIPFEKVAFLEKVAKNYQRLIDDKRFTFIDATESVEDITKHCLDVILSDK